MYEQDYLIFKKLDDDIYSFAVDKPRNLFSKASVEKLISDLYLLINETNDTLFVEYSLLTLDEDRLEYKLTEFSHRIINIHEKDGNYYGFAECLNTHKGKQFQMDVDILKLNPTKDFVLFPLLFGNKNQLNIYEDLKFTRFVLTPNFIEPKILSNRLKFNF